MGIRTKARDVLKSSDKRSQKQSKSKYGMTLADLKEILKNWKRSPQSQYPDLTDEKLPALLKSTACLFPQRCYERGWAKAVSLLRNYLRENHVPKEVLDILPPEYPGYRASRVRRGDAPIAPMDKGRIAYFEAFRRSERDYTAMLLACVSMPSSIPTGDRPEVKRKQTMPKAFEEKIEERRAKKRSREAGNE